jgi:hypothetical protein
MAVCQSKTLVFPHLLVKSWVQDLIFAESTQGWNFPADVSTQTAHNYVSANKQCSCATEQAYHHYCRAPLIFWNSHSDNKVWVHKPIPALVHNCTIKVYSCNMLWTDRNVKTAGLMTYGNVSAGVNSLLSVQKVWVHRATDGNLLMAL